MTLRTQLLSLMGKTSPLTPRASSHLDMIRGIAALAVMVGHIRGLFFLDYRDVPHKSALLGALYAVTGLGHQAVMVFFVLSGFLIGGNVLSGIQRWSWKRYLINRFCRLYLVLIPALLLTALLDFLAYRQAAGPYYFDQPIAHYNNEALATHRTVAALAGNAAFLQEILVPPYGSNSPLWSLTNEFWYYLLFPALILACYPKASRKLRLWGLFIVVVLVTLLPGGPVLTGGILTAFLIWLLGVVVHAMPFASVGRLARYGLHAATFGLFAGVLMLSRLQKIPDRFSDPAVGLAFAVWLYCLVKIKTSPKGISHFYDWWAKLFSKCSYSLYTVHFPLVLLIRCRLGRTLWAPNLHYLTLALGLCVIVFLYGFLFSRLTEAHNESVRSRLLRIGNPAPASKVAVGSAR